MPDQLALQQQNTKLFREKKPVESGLTVKPARLLFHVIFSLLSFQAKCAGSLMLTSTENGIIKFKFWQNLERFPFILMPLGKGIMIEQNTTGLSREE